MIPSSTFKMARVGHVCDTVLGKMLQTTPKTPGDQEVPYLRAGFLETLSDLAELPTMYARDSEVRALGLREGDLIVAEGGDVGRSEMAPRLPQRTIFQNSLHRIRLRAGGDIRFVRYALSSIYSSGWLDVLCNRATFGHLTVEKLRQLHIPWPRPSEQTAIADYLDTETNHIDTLITKKRRMIELLEERLREVERSVTLSANAPRVPLRWTMRIGSGEGLPSSTLSDNPVGGVPVYGGNGLMGYTPMQSRVNEHSIAVGRVGALCGNVHLVDPPAWITDNALWVRAIRGFDREFLATALRSTNLNTHADRTAQPLITGETVKNLAIPQPSDDKQIEIAKAIRAARNKKMQLSDRLGRQLDLLRERRRALVTAAVTGDLSVA